jgi:hypothetical protein
MKVMSLAIKIGLDMHLPEGKLPGYYAQIVKGIAERAPLFDRHKELLVFDSEEHLPAVLELLSHYKVSHDRCSLLLVPSKGWVKGSLFEDYAIETRSDNLLFDLAQTAVFSMAKAKPDAEPAPALLQLDEHLIGQLNIEHDIEDAGAMLIFMDRQLMELAERICRAYGCSVRWHY